MVKKIKKKTFIINFKQILVVKNLHVDYHVAQHRDSCWVSGALRDDKKSLTCSQTQKKDKTKPTAIALIPSLDY